MPDQPAARPPRVVHDDTAVPSAPLAKLAYPPRPYTPVEVVAIAWWRSNAEDGQTDEEHALDPYRRLPYKPDWLLADAVVSLLGLDR